MNRAAKSFLVVGGAALVGAAGYMLMDSGAESAVGTPQSVLASSAASVREAASAGQDAAGQIVASGEILVYKTAACGCCGLWVEYLEEHGFTVRTEDVSNLAVVKVELGVPPRLQSCHTAVIDGYVIEGHVPLESIQRLLEERPEVDGLAVPGMPIGSPGMEMPGRPPDPYAVVTFDSEGHTEVYENR